MVMRLLFLLGLKFREVEGVTWGGVEGLAAGPPGAWSSEEPAEELFLVLGWPLPWGECWDEAPPPLAETLVDWPEKHHKTSLTR